MHRIETKLVKQFFLVYATARNSRALTIGLKTEPVILVRFQVRFKLIKFWCPNFLSFLGHFLSVSIETFYISD